MYPKIEIPIPNELKRLALLFKQAGHTLYAVGGLIRNSLLGLPFTDVDICSSMRPDDVVSLCRENSLNVVLKGIAFGMVEIHIGDKAFEHTTFRADTYCEGGAHRPSSVRFSDTLYEDAFRRDFSVNALYADILTGEIFDPTGGIDDLNRRLLRTTSEDPETVLKDDGLRIMRLVRFASELSFDIEENTLKAAKKLAGNLKDISGERIRDELNKILLCDIKYGKQDKNKVYKALTLFRDTGAMQVILPELYAGAGILQKPAYHKYDVLDHSLHTASECRAELTMRLSGLLHDVGKSSVYKRTGRMYGHELAGADISREILYSLHYDTGTINEAVFLIRNHMYDINNTAKDSTLRKTFVRFGYERSLALADMREADVHGSGIIKGAVDSAERWRTLLKKMRAENVPFSENELKCTGQDIMEWLSIKPCKRVGEIKHALLMHCALFPADNTKEKLRKTTEDLQKSIEKHKKT